MNNKSIFLIFITFFLSIVFISGCSSQPGNQPGNDSIIACTQEAKLCPDGTAVGRVGPKCEFAPCPTDTGQNPGNSGEWIDCTADQRGTGDSACTEIYAPVCGLTNVQCIRAPCPPVEMTYPNPCEACHNSLVSKYKDGECLS